MSPTTSFDALLQILSPGTGTNDAARLHASIGQDGQLDNDSTTRVHSAVLAMRPPASAEFLGRTNEPAEIDGRFSPFLKSLRHGEQIARELDLLARANNVETAERAVRTIFIDHLAYDPVGLDETRRLRGETIKKLLLVAKSDSFCISLGFMDWGWRYPNVAKPIFQLHPNGLVILCAPAFGSCRFHFRANNSNEIRIRTLAGRSPAPHPLDNLAVWARRLDALRPQFEDDEDRLKRRASHALSSEPKDICDSWRSVTFRASERPPGIDWPALPHSSLQAFLQPDAAVRGFWGLERVLRCRFPVPVSEGKASLHYCSYEIQPDIDQPEQAIAEGRTWVRRLTIRFKLRLGQTERDLTIAASVPCLGPGLRMVLDGKNGRLSPRLDWSSVEIEESPDQNDFESLETELLKEPAPRFSMNEDELAQPVPSSDEPVDVPVVLAAEKQVFEGTADPCAIFEMAVAAKLSALAVRLWNQPFGSPSSDNPSTWKPPARVEVASEAELANSILHAFRRVGGSDPEILLTSRAALERLFVPIRDPDSPECRLGSLRSLDPIETIIPPAWACIDTARDLTPGEFIPVNAARLTPAGRLAIPAKDDKESISLISPCLSALKINPRCGGEGPGPREWWVAHGLEVWAGLPPGRLHSPSYVAAYASRIDMPALHAPADRLCARIAPELLKRTRLLERRWVRMQFPLPLDKQVEIVVQEGQHVQAGDVWLRQEAIPLEQEEQPARREPFIIRGLVAHDRLLQSVFEEEGLHRDNAPCWRVPPGVQGLVVKVDAIPILRHNIEVGVLFSLQIQPLPTGDLVGHLVLDDGRLAPLSLLRREDAPYGQDGEPARLLIEDPLMKGNPAESEKIWFGSADGELLETTETSNCAVLPGQPAMLIGVDTGMRVRARDGEGIPAHPLAPGLPASHRLWWLGRDPNSAQALLESEKQLGAGEIPVIPRLEEVLGCAGLRSHASLTLNEFRAGLPPRSGKTQSRSLFPLSNRNQRKVDSRPRNDWPFEYGCGHPCVECPEERTPPRQRRSALDAYSACVTYEETNKRHPDKKETAAGQRRLLRYRLMRLQRRHAADTEILALPEPVLHPWRLEAAAGLLGVEMRQLLALQARSGGRILLAKAYHAEPSKAAALLRTQLGVLTGKPRSDAGRRLFALERHLQLNPGAIAASLFVQALPVLPPQLTPVGEMHGFATLVDSPLLAAYQQVQHASRRLVALLPSTVLAPIVEARRRLQEAVNLLFGRVDTGGNSREPRTLSELLVRLWPITRPGRLRSSMPGLHLARGQVVRDGEGMHFDAVSLAPEDESLQPNGTGPIECDDAANYGKRTLAISLQPSSIGARRLGIVSASGMNWAPQLPAISFDPSSAEYWRERQAIDVTIRNLLPLLFTLFRGRHGCARLSDLLAGLEEPGAAPSSLTGLLTARLPLPLPADGQAALNVVHNILEKAFPGMAIGRLQARQDLAVLLAGFWRLDACPEAPLGWTWRKPLQDAPSRARRMLPTLSSQAWQLFPESDAAFAPARYFLNNSGALIRSDCEPLRTALGLAASDVREERGLGVGGQDLIQEKPVQQSAPFEDSVPLPQPPISPEEPASSSRTIDIAPPVSAQTGTRDAEPSPRSDLNAAPGMSVSFWNGSLTEWLRGDKE